MREAYHAHLLKDLEKKMVFLCGPRQVGKTHLAKSLMPHFSAPLYLNYDFSEDRKIIKAMLWRQATDLLILDEIHKMPNWKNFVKGVYDTRPPHLRILVTGSARLDAIRKGGDSLAGRYFLLHLMPLTPAEFRKSKVSYDAQRLWERGGFPEPYLAGEAHDADRWRNLYIDSLIRGDILDMGRVDQLKAMVELTDLLRDSVGSPVSYQSLARDLQISPPTVKRYIELLESVYVVFRVRTYTKKIKRSILKEPKIYFFDWCLARNEGARLENMLAVFLLKHTLLQYDILGKKYSLHYLRNRQEHEVDFGVALDGILEKLYEAKISAKNVGSGIAYFHGQTGVPAEQLVLELRKEHREKGIDVVSLFKTAESFFF